MANLVYANDYQQSQAVEDTQREIDQQQEIVDHYDSIRDNAWAERKSARENLISAKEYLVSALEFDDPEQQYNKHNKLLMHVNPLTMQHEKQPQQTKMYWISYSKT
jgi:hypothetical protein